MARVIAAALAAVFLAAAGAPARADWSGDGSSDVLAVDPGERLLLTAATALFVMCR